RRDRAAHVPRCLSVHSDLGPGQPRDAAHAGAGDPKRKVRGARRGKASHRTGTLTMDRDRALQLVYDAIDAINPQLPQPRRLRKTPETVIVGPSGSLDSLAIINFVLTLEERASDAVGAPVQLLDDTALIAENSPFRTVDALARHLERLGHA